MAIDTPMIQGGIAAYRAGRDMSAPAPGSERADAARGTFADMLANAAQTASQTVQTGEQVGKAGLMGEANLQQVIEATMAMESTVKVSVAVRDSVVQSYQEILRMPV